MFVRLLSILSVLSLTTAQYAFPDCVNGPLSKIAICDPSQPAVARAQSLVRLMNTTEKALRLQNGSPAIERLGLPAYEWWSEGLHGVAIAPGVNWTESGTYSCATSFPEPIGLAAAFDRELVKLTSTVISDEFRAFSNADRANLTPFTPNINIFRDPRWGRGQETPGEDTYLTGEYAYYIIDGYQRGEDNRYHKIVADCKHYAGYDLEHWVRPDGSNADRQWYSANITNLDMVETYLPPFKSCLKDAQAGSAMCSYNAINGVPSCANGVLMNDIARGRWGWKGWITSDCGAVTGILDYHHYAKNHSQQMQMALRAGCDIGCDPAYTDFVPQAIKDGSITQDDLDLALGRQFESLISLGYFDPADQQVYRQYGPEKIASEFGNTTSYRAAAESIVLLKNDGTLPLSRDMIKSVAVIGPNAFDKQTQIGNYFGYACFMTTPREGFEQIGLQVNYALGIRVNSNDTSGYSYALQQAKASDAIVFFGGLNQTIEEEGLDRVTIDLPGMQADLIKQLGRLGKPLIVVYWGGGGIDVSAQTQDASVNAMMWHGYPSQWGGLAIANAVFGDVKPAGRLVTTWYPAEYVYQVPMDDQSMRQSPTNPGRTYKFYMGHPVYPFGHGLTYSEFSYETVTGPPKTLAISDLAALHAGRFDDRDVHAAEWTVNVTNIGKVQTDIVVLAFVAGNAAAPGVVPPIKELFDFTRIHDMKPGTSQVITFGISYRVLSTIDPDGHAWLLPGHYRFAINNEAEEIYEFDLVGEPLLVEESPVTPFYAYDYEAKPKMTKLAYE